MNLFDEDELERCKGCGADIRFRQARSGKWMPCDPELVTILSKSGDVVTGYVPHFVTCPDADQFRRRSE